MERFSYHCRMINPDLSSILDDLAAGRIDTAEANRVYPPSRQTPAANPAPVRDKKKPPRANRAV